MERKNVNSVMRSLLRDHGAVASRDLAGALGITRQAAHRHLRAFARAGMVRPEGKGRAARYVASQSVSDAPPDWISLASHAAESSQLYRSFLAADLQEDHVWNVMLSASPLLGALSSEGRAVFQYALTEIVNNAIDHAKARTIGVAIATRGEAISLEVTDDGVGIWKHLRESLGLADDLHAVQELSKGKVTTDPDRHTGEGIFFSSKVADHFEMEGSGLAWVVDNMRDDMTVRPAPPRIGTRVRFEASPIPRRRLADVFAAFTEDLSFNKTRTVIKLFAMGTTFVSRSEGKRLVHGLEFFREVELDFAGVESVGQGFVDEVFRVWAAVHPQTRFVVKDASPTVAFMINRGRPK